MSKIVLKKRDKKRISYLGSDGQTYRGKGAKARKALERSQRHWDTTFKDAQSKRGTLPRQRPGSMKAW